MVHANGVGVDRKGIAYEDGGDEGRVVDAGGEADVVSLDD